MPKQFINPPNMKPLGKYSTLTVAQGGSIVFISGQVSVDGDGKVVGAGDIEAQAVQVFENLKCALSGIGATFEDVIKFTIYIVGFSQQRRKAVMDARNLYISHSDHGRGRSARRAGIAGGDRGDRGARLTCRIAAPASTFPKACLPLVAWSSP